MKKINLASNRLAINGGRKFRSKLWSDNFTIGFREKIAVLKSLSSGYLSLFEGSNTPDYPFSFFGGPNVRNLEQEWSEYYSVNHSIAMNSATSGLFAAIGALEIGYGDEVIVSPYTMTACALAPLVYGAIPVFADIDPETGCLDPKSILKKISKNTKAILVVHQFGYVAEMDEILDIGKKYNLKIIEDCAQAHGAKYKNKNVGTLGDIGVFSLNVNKTIQSGEGGICVTNSKELAYRLQLIRNHGEAVVGPANYQNITNILGFNFRMTEFCAAIASVQLKKLKLFNLRRLNLVEKLNKYLEDHPFFSPLKPIKRLNNDISNGTLQTFYIYPICFDKDKTNYSREEIVRSLNAEGLKLSMGYVKPLYLQPLYQKKTLFKHSYPFNAPPNLNLNQKYDIGTCPNSEMLHNYKLITSEHIRYPHNNKDINDICRIIDKITNSAT